jgi:small-conductance mechanosensitive channel
MPKEIITSIVESTQSVTGGIILFVPKFIGATVLLALGWLFGAAVGRVVQQLTELAKLDEHLKKSGFDRLLVRAGYTLNSGLFLGWLAKLFFIVIFLMAALQVLGLSSVNDYLKVVLGYIPQVIVASLMLFIASIAADFFSSLIGGTSKAMGSSVAHLLSVVVRWSIWIFAIIFALSQLGIAREFMLTLFTGIVAMLALAGGLAFGLGGKDAAAEFIKSIRQEIKEGK